mgnify:CR=1 FL=1
MTGRDSVPEAGTALIMASVSGGKDSTAMALHLKELGHDYKCTFADTGWEDPQTYDYIREQLPKALGPIKWVRQEIELEGEREELAQKYEARLGFYSPMVRLCLKKSIFPSRLRRWCTTELKVKPLKQYMWSFDDYMVNAVGIRAEESVRRAQMPMFEWSASMKMDVWRPLLDWKLQDVIDIHKRHGIKPNPKYLQGAERVGCWPCVFARKAEVRRLGEDDVRVGILRDLEVDMTRLQNDKRGEQGLEPVEATGWFQARTGYVYDADGNKKRDGGRWSIDKVVDWSRTGRGGKQFEMFAAAGRDAGCVRWGFCDTGKDGDDS